MGSNRFDNSFAEADDAFDGMYKDELNKLEGLSKAEVNLVTPNDTEALKVYENLIQVVKKASRDNVKQADLIKDIKELGEVAVKIARKIPQFAALL